MKAEFDGLKGSDGEIRLFPESIDDIWHIKHLIRTGDLIFADTFRSLDSQTDKTRPEKTEKNRYGWASGWRRQNSTRTPSG